MVEPRCAHCRHWIHEAHSWDANAIGFRRCAAVRERWKIEDEASEKRMAEGVRRAAVKAARAYVEDGSEYHAALVTAGDFSCALFEP